MGYDRAAKGSKDPNGAHFRLYDKIFDSPAWKALSPHDVLAYLALGRELKGSNNGNLALPLTSSTECGIKHHVTLARSLRALRAVGLLAITSKGGSDKGGHRQPTLYRFTYLDSSGFSKRLVEAVKASNEWMRVTNAGHGRALIQAAEDSAKKTSAKTKTAGHAVTAIVSPRVLVEPKTRTPGDTWPERPGHAVTMVEKAENPATVRVVAGFLEVAGNAIHRTSRVPPLQVAIHSNRTAHLNVHGAYLRLRAKPVALFTRLSGMEQLAA